MKIAIVTGASSGMGRECAIQMGDRFSKIEEIWLIARRKKRLEELKGQIPVKIRCFGIDITLGEQRQELKRGFGEGEAGCEAACKCRRRRNHGKNRPGGFGDGVCHGSTKLRGFVCRYQSGLPYMSKNSRIVQFASAAAFLPQPGFGIYAGTKAFVLSYARALGGGVKRKADFCAGRVPWGCGHRVFWNKQGRGEPAVLQENGYGKTKEGGGKGSEG